MTLDIWNKFLQHFKKVNICIFGETHGIKQNYDIYSNIVNLLGIKQIGIEIDISDYYPWDFLLEYNGDIKFFVKNVDKVHEGKFLDGRVQDNLLDFIAQMKGRGVKIFFFDDWSGFSSDNTPKTNSRIRDKNMADIIYQHTFNKEFKTLIISGTAHTTPKKQYSMYNQLSNLHNTKIPIIKIEYIAGGKHLTSQGIKNITDKRLYRKRKFLYDETSGEYYYFYHKTVEPVHYGIQIFVILARIKMFFWWNQYIHNAG